MGRIFAESDLETTALAEYLANLNMGCPNAKEFALQQSITERDGPTSSVVDMPDKLCSPGVDHHQLIERAYNPNHRQNMLCSSVCRTNYHTILD
jgi:hypothetical protein